MKKEIINKINRNERFVLSTIAIKYHINKETNTTICIGTFKILFRRKIIECIDISDSCIKSPTDVNNEEFAKKLARARVERSAYKYFKSYFMNISLDELIMSTIHVEGKKINPYKLLTYINNSIKFAEDMIAHQNHYIYKVY